MSKGTRFLHEGGRYMRITMTVIAPPGATLQDVKEYLHELEYAGSNHLTEHPMFESLYIESSHVRMHRRVVR